MSNKFKKFKFVKKIKNYQKCQFFLKNYQKCQTFFKNYQKCQIFFKNVKNVSVVRVTRSKNFKIKQFNWFDQVNWF